VFSRWYKKNYIKRVIDRLQTNKKGQVRMDGAMSEGDSPANEVRICP
jgi:hypothetical protein